MRAHRPAALLATLLTIAGLAAVIGAGTAAGDRAAAGARKITPAGVGAVKLGATFRSLRRHHRVGPLRGGCELAGPGAHSARLRAPLKGAVDLTRRVPRRVADIVLSGGAKARGVGIGATVAQIKAAFRFAKVDHGTDAMFGLTLVKIPEGHGGRLQFAVSTKTHRTTRIGVPFIPFCE
jgi:hypothetical protein